MSETPNSNQKIDTPSAVPESMEDSNNEEGIIPEREQTANSLRCDDCDKLFRNMDYAQMHAHKSGHANFSESTETLKPLTEEEKAAKLKELMARMEHRREQKRIQEIEERKESERIRRKAGKDLIEAQERLKEKEMRDTLEQKKREKSEEAKHKARVLAEIERDKQDRLARQARSKQLPQQQPVAVKVVQPMVSKGTSNTARLQIRGAGGSPLVHEFAADALLKDVLTWLSSEGIPEGKLSTTFPRRVFGAPDLDKSLRELGLVPNAALNYMQS